MAVTPNDLRDMAAANFPDNVSGEIDAKDMRDALTLIAAIETVILRLASENSGKIFGSRAEAVAFGQDGLPAELSRIIVLEGNAIVFRNPQSTADSLFDTSPRWGVSKSFDKEKFATAAQGALADSAVQPAALNSLKVDLHDRRPMAVGSADFSGMTFPSDVHTVIQRESSDASIWTSRSNEPPQEAVKQQDSDGRWWQRLWSRSEMQADIDAKAASIHEHTAAQISDAGATGRVVLKTSTKSEARTALGLGSAATSENTAFATAAQGSLADWTRQTLDVVIRSIAGVGQFETLQRGDKEILPTVVSYDGKMVKGVDLRTGLSWSQGDPNHSVAHGYDPIVYIGGRAKFIEIWSYDAKPLRGWSLDTGLPWSADDPYDHKSFALNSAVVDGREVHVLAWSYDGKPVDYYFKDTGMPPALPTPKAFEITTRLRAVGAVGQSNGVGSSYEVSSNVYPHPRGDLVVLGGDGRDDIWLQRSGSSGSIRIDFNGLDRLVPLQSRVSGGRKGTCSVEGTCHALLNAGSPPILTFNESEGGEKIQNLLPDPPEEGKFAWENTVATMERMQQVKRADQYIEYDWLLMTQGESNTTNENLGELHNLYRANVETEAKRIFGQKSAVKMITRQPSSFTSRTDGVLSILQEALAQKDSGTFFLAGPTYCYEFGEDFLHHSSVAHALRGEFDAAVIRYIEEHGKYLPLHATGAYVTGANEVTVVLNKAALVDSDDPVVEPIDRWGVELTGTSIGGITLDGTQMVIETTGSAENVTAIRFGLSTQTSPRTEAAIPRTNIRAEDYLGIYSNGTPMKQWHCHQELIVGE